MARKSRAASREDQGLPVRLVTLGILAVLAFMLWGWACMLYDSAHGVAVAAPAVPIGRRIGGMSWMIRGFAVFVWNAVVHIPQVFSVIGYVCTQELGFVGISTGVFAAAAGFGFWLSRLEKSLAETNPFSKKTSRNRPRGARR